MSGSNAPGRRSTRRTRGRSQERTTFAYLLDYEGLHLEPAAPSPCLEHDDHVWFTTTFINYCGRQEGRRPITARVEVSIPGSRIEHHVKQALSQDIDGAAAALAEESDQAATVVAGRPLSGTPEDEWRLVYDTPKAEQRLGRLTVSVRPLGGRMTRAEGRGTLLGVPKTDRNKSNFEPDSSAAASPTIGPSSDVETREPQGFLGAENTGLRGLQLPARQSVEREGALAQLRETLDRLRAHATEDPQFRKLVLKTIEDYACEVRTMAPPNPRSGPRAEPPRVGHPIIEDLGKLWDEREAMQGPERARRLQQILNRFHEKESLGSFALNSVATRWVNRIATKCRIKLMLNGQAVTVRCANQGARDGYFLPRYARRDTAAVPDAGSNSFPKLTAIAI